MINQKNLANVLIKVNLKISFAKIIALKLAIRLETYLGNLVSNIGEILHNKIAEQLRVNLIMIF